jgi:SpoVK/Ycf46/Vps4 family AAA+-type ATPase
MVNENGLSLVCENVQTMLSQALEAKQEARTASAGSLSSLLYATRAAALLQAAYDLARTQQCEMDCAWIEEIDRQRVEIVEKFLKEIERMVDARVRSRGGRRGGSSAAAHSTEDPASSCDTVKPLASVDCIYFKDLIGMEDEKQQLLNYFIYPLIYPNLYPKGAKALLLFGPPGTGKTLLAKAAVNELQTVDPNVGVVFYAPTGADLKGRYVGETEKRISALFECASAQARACEQSNQTSDRRYIAVLFIDEIDAIAGDRSKDESGMMSNSVNTLLQKMDGISSYDNVMVLAATNFPQNLDSAVRRRFAREIMVSLPGARHIQEVVEQQLVKYAAVVDAKQTKAASATMPSEPTNPCKSLNPPRCPKPPMSFESHGFAVTSEEVRGLAEEMSLRRYSNSDVVRVVTAAINVAAARALRGTFSLYSCNGKQAYLADNAAPATDNLMWTKDARAPRVGPFALDGSIMFEGQAYVPDWRTVQEFLVDGVRAVYASPVGQVLLIGAHGLGPFSFYIHVPNPPMFSEQPWLQRPSQPSRLRRLLGINGARVFLVSDDSAYEVEQLRKRLLDDLCEYWQTGMTREELGYTHDVIFDLQPYDKEDTDDVEEDSDDDALRAASQRMLAITDDANFRLTPSAAPRAGPQKIRQDDEDAMSFVRGLLKTLHVTAQDFNDAMQVVRSSIKQSELKTLEQYQKNGAT